MIRCAVCSEPLEIDSNYSHILVHTTIDGQPVCTPCEQRGRFWACRQAFQEKQSVETVRALRDAAHGQDKLLDTEEPLGMEPRDHGLPASPEGGKGMPNSDNLDMPI